MSDSNNDPNLPILNLTHQERTAFAHLFSLADNDQLGVVTGERAVTFFERTKVSPIILGEIWQIADTENRGLLTKPGFCMVLRLIGHYQAGREPSAELALRPAPVPKFEGMTIPGVNSGAGTPQQAQSPTLPGFPAGALQPQLSGQNTGPIRVPPLDPQKVAQYSGLFERSGAVNGLLDGGTTKSIFERAGLPNEVLGKIWMLSDREQRGALDQTEFIVAMHLLTSMKSRAMPALPNTLPPGLYEAAARRGTPLPSSRPIPGQQGVIPRQFTGSSINAPLRTQSPLAIHPQGYGTPSTQSAQPSGGVGIPWLITPQEKFKYDQFFATLDPPPSRGIITGEQAVRFFSDSGLPEDTLASIWDLADINSTGQLTRDEFAVAMYLIRQQRMPNAGPLPAFLPLGLIPPSMRKGGVTQQTQRTTAPAFDNVNNTSNLPKSAADDLFGLDQPSPPKAQAQLPQQPAVLQSQGTGASATRDPFGTSVPASPSSPQQQQKFQPQGQQGSSSVFKPFQPTSMFGASLQQQNTGGSTTSSQGQQQARGLPQQQQQQQPQQQQQAYKPPQSTTMDDLLGDSEDHTTESNKMTAETTELANMSSQLGNLRTQMGETQSKKSVSQADLEATANQKRELEARLQQFRAQYEAEVRAVKELEQQLATSKESTKKLGQELAMLEGSVQDLRTQKTSVAQALEADQRENLGLKQKIVGLNSEVKGLKPEMERLRLEARQVRGLVSIGRKQAVTVEGERDGLIKERGFLEGKIAEGRARAGSAEQQPMPPPSMPMSPASGGEAELARTAVASPAASTLSSTNPFFRKTSAGSPPPSSALAERAVSPITATQGAPTPSAFDRLFGPAGGYTAPHQQQPGASGIATPPATSFIGRNLPAAAAGGTVSVVAAAGGAAAAAMTDSVSSDGRPTPSATPPLSDKGEQVEGPPAPLPEESRQFTPSQLPYGSGPGLEGHKGSEDGSTRVLPAASRDDEEEGNRGASPVPPAASTGGGFGSPEPTASEPTGAAHDENEGGSGPSAVKAESLPGAFPDEPARMTEREVVDSTPAGGDEGRDHFNSAFAGFGEGDVARKTGGAEQKEEDPFALPGSSLQELAQQTRGFEDDAFVPSQSSATRPAEQAHISGIAAAFPPVLNHEPEQDSSDDDEGPERPKGYQDEFVPNEPSSARANEASSAAAAAKQAEDDAISPAPRVASGTDLATARPTMTSIESTASDLPAITSQTSPPTYEESTPHAQGGTGERSASNSFPPEFGGLLPAREDPTSPPAHLTANAASASQTSPPQTADSDRPFQTSEMNGQSPFPQAVTRASTAGTGTGSEAFFDASSRPMSGITNASAGSPAALQQQQPGTGPAGAPAQKNEFDEFDEFDDLSEAKEADKSGGANFDFGFGSPAAHENAEFNPAFDSPAASMTNTMASSQQTPTPSVTQRSMVAQGQGESDGFADWTLSASALGSSGPFSSGAGGVGGAMSGNSSLQQTPQNVQHDWDAIFSGLDNSANKDIDTTFPTVPSGTATHAADDEPWSATTSVPVTNGASMAETPRAVFPAASLVPTAKPAYPLPPGPPPSSGLPALGRAVTPGTEHDDPILKRLTGMGYARGQALNALEMFDYDINKAVDHLTSS